MIGLRVQAAYAVSLAPLPLLEEAGEETTRVHRDSEDEANTNGVGMRGGDGKAVKAAQSRLSPLTKEGAEVFT